MEVCVLFSPRSDLTLRSVEKANKAILGAIGAAGEDSALTSLLGFHTAGDHLHPNWSPDATTER